ncbi:hypothetical protein SAMD00019534_031380 [Acytostelium subglobosum LB1]|uniref:hypothetical protein n=1 Tax=Acytostelium subglobosum LB1 TaxID=1410327 RepID=UPI0006449F5F|nr:hypothetical protein SAMD00019534_031380 [Acytostelium subglobosum LB1]GAM19963.1 hypothetical protein SAMD00019534_031380 [Acytostelium subglobosum LB1]|eukprot:XP_012756725.1 hypothetical protein SAMD00019534_031380 [Acytostelium subglobosum LB1]
MTTTTTTTTTTNNTTTRTLLVKRSRDQVEFNTSGDDHEDDEFATSDAVDDTDADSKSATMVKKSATPFVCPYKCGKAFNRQGKLDCHIRTHTGERPYECKECGKSFTRTHHLKYHMRSHTGEHPFQCSHIGCGVKFVHKHQMDLHIRVQHLQEKPFKCDHDPTICQLTFHKHNQLKRHIDMVHLNQLPYGCTYEGCTARFLYPSYLKNHVNTVHTKVAKFVCSQDDCFQSFFTHYELQKHIKALHKKVVQTHPCPTCGKLCKTRTLLKLHAEIHAPLSERYNFPCEYEGCQRVYAAKRNLEQHIRQVHKKTKVYECKCIIGGGDAAGEPMDITKPMDINQAVDRLSVHVDIRNNHGTGADSDIDNETDKETDKETETDRENYNNNNDNNNDNKVVLCGKKFASKVVLERHIYNMHTNAKPRGVKKLRVDCLLLVLSMD